MLNEGTYTLCPGLHIIYLDKINQDKLQTRIRIPCSRQFVKS